MGLFGKLFGKKEKTAEEWFNEGRTLAKLERYEEAIRCFDKALEIDPKFVDAWCNKGMCDLKKEAKGGRRRHGRKQVLCVRREAWRRQC
jgi:tetratricopeptide (TPR) repeat protein